MDRLSLSIHRPCEGATSGGGEGEKLSAADIDADGRLRQLLEDRLGLHASSVSSDSSSVCAWESLPFAFIIKRIGLILSKEKGAIKPWLFYDKDPHF
jgi:hypothetical protein